MMKAVLHLKQFYEIVRIEDIKHIRKLFGEDTNYQLNWLFLSTSGVHGNYQTLDYIEENWGTPVDEDDIQKYYATDITVLIVQPRLCNLHYGTIEIDYEDIEYLRGLVVKTIEGVGSSQKGNLSSKQRIRDEKDG